jgi:hypothetical protein
MWLLSVQLNCLIAALRQRLAETLEADEAALQLFR